MPLPFTHDQFLDVFAAYNRALWPAALVLWVLTAVAAWRWSGNRGAARPAVFLLLALHWLWSGVAYHWRYFSAINPVASIFALAFVLEAVVLTWEARPSPGVAARTGGLRGVIGVSLIGYGLAYPALGLAFGLAYPRMPLFAVPCPTTLVTAGFLLATPGVGRLAAVVPLLWSAIGASAAFMLGIRADMALVIAALALLTVIVRPARPGFG